MNYTLSSANNIVDLYVGLGLMIDGVDQANPASSNSFDGGAGNDAIIEEHGYGDTKYFTLSASETGVITMTTASGTQTFKNFEKLQWGHYSGGTTIVDFTIKLGTAAADTIAGGAAADKFLYGLAGNDSISGGGGADKIMGGAGNDTLKGDAGNDLILGGAGRDVMTGGGGNDTFDFNAITEMSKLAASRDVITDFTHLADKIDLSTIDASTVSANNQAFKFIGAAGFHKVAGELNFVKNDLAGTVNDKTIVQGDITGDGLADFHIQLTGLKALVASDFIL